ncbi:MAG: family 20 glycosylhydrolase [Nevskiales bacterium]
MRHRSFCGLLCGLQLGAGLLAGCDSGSSDVTRAVIASYSKAEFGTANRPQTIPALRLWAPGQGEFAYSSTSRIVIPSGGAALTDTAALFVEDLWVLTGNTHTVANGTPGKGDIHLRLGRPDSELGEEGYELNIGEAAVITAPTAAGVFYGTRSLLQLLRQNDTIPAGIARDWPRYPERGLMVDIGRMHFSVQWLSNHIRELAWLKLNYLHLHFSDNEGWRIESQTHPEIVSTPHLSKAEVRELIALAARHHITVVPEIDMPGHMTAALAPHPEFQLANLLGQREADKLDVSNDDARTYARELISEYLELFPGPYWHMGADEYLGIVSTALNYQLYPQLQDYARAKHGAAANHKDAVLDFINEINSFVRSHGKTMRVWHDGLGGGHAVTVPNNIVVEVWNEFAGAQPPELLSAGHKIMNCGWYPTYYTQHVFSLIRPNMKPAYETWDVFQFHGPLELYEPIGLPPTEIDPDEPLNLGSKIHVWSDVPQFDDENGVAEGIYPRLRMLAQKTWNSEKLVGSYEEFQAIMDAAERAPGYQ